VGEPVRTRDASRPTALVEKGTSDHPVSVSHETAGSGAFDVNSHASGTTSCMPDVKPAAAPTCPLLRFLQQHFRQRCRKRRARRGLVIVALLAAWVGVALPRPARGGSLDALDPFDPVGSDPWQGPLVPTELYTPAEPPSRGRGPWLGIGAGLQGSPGERRRVFALVELGLPLDVLAGAHASGAETNDAADSADGFAPDAPGSGVAEPMSRERSGFSAVLAPSSPAPGESSAISSSAARASDAALPGSAGLPARGALDGAAWLPPLPGCDAARSCDPAVLMPLARAVVAVALQTQGGQAELRRLDGMAARSRAAASLPEVRLGAGTSRDESLRLAPTAADPARFTRDGGRDLWLEARLTWRLDSAIFARDEIAIMRLRAQQREELARLVSEVLEALVAFERARLRLASDLATSDERDQARVVQFGALARLDVLTDGWFSRRLERAASSGRDGVGTGAREPARGWP
jgi:hypothetical protein